MIRVWVACWDCGQQHLVEEREQYTAHQVCEACIEERRERWSALVAGKGA
jgi:hypothetical protein